MKSLRKKLRLNGWDYSQEGAYFLTLCALDRKCLFSKVVGRGILDAPMIQLYSFGLYIQEALEYLQNNNPNIMIHNWVIMPNHVHILLSLRREGSASSSAANAKIPKFVSSLKRCTNKMAGIKLWQTSYYDHIIRDDEDFLRRWQYIDRNPSAWNEDDYFTD